MRLDPFYSSKNPDPTYFKHFGSKVEARGAALSFGKLYLKKKIKHNCVADPDPLFLKKKKSDLTTLSM